MEFTPTSKELTVPINTPPMRKILSQSEINQTKTKVSDISQTESDVPIAPPRLRRKKSPLNAKAVDETKATATIHVESNKMITHAETKSSNQHPKKLLTLSVFSQPLPGRPGPPTRPPPLTSSYRPNRPPPPKINTKCVTLTHNQPVGKIPNCTSSTIIKTKYVTEGPVDMLKQLVQKPNPNRYTKKGFLKQYEGRQLPDQMTPPVSCIRQPIYETVLPLKNDNDTDDDSEQEDDPENMDMSGGYCIPEVTSTHIYGEQEDEYIKMAKKTLQQSMTPIPNKGMEFTPTSKELTVPINTPPMKKILSQSEISQTKTKVSDISQAEFDVPIAPPRLRRKKSPLNAPITKEVDTPLDSSPIPP